MKIYLVIWSIGLVVRVFDNGPGDQNSIPSRVIPKTRQMVLDASLLNTHHYSVWIKDKWSNLEKLVALFPYTSV